MKIVHVVQWLALGGGESVAVTLATRQRLRGDRVRVVCLQEETGALEATLRQHGVQVHFIPRLRAGFDPTLWPALWARFARWRPDVVHSHDPKSLVFGAPAGRASGSRTVHTKHGLDVDSSRRLRLVRGAARALDVCVAVSAETGHAAGEESPGVPIEVIENGIDVDRRRADRTAARARLGLPPNAWVLGTIGRLEPVKGHDILIEAARPLLDAGAHLCIIGDGSLRDRLPQHPNLHLAGLIPDAANWLSAFDGYVQPSRSEGLPLAVLEAMAAGLPIVASAVGQLPVLLDGAGIVVPAEDPAALRAALTAIRSSDLGTAARARVAREYSINRTLSAYDAVYRG